MISTALHKPARNGAGVERTVRRLPTFLRKDKFQFGISRGHQFS
jgi:hypothetical protein